MTHKRMAVLGAGSFGVALAKTMADLGHPVTLWARDEEVVRHLNKTHRHPHRLSSIVLPDSLKASHDLEASLKGASVVISTLPMLALRSVWSRAARFLEPNALVISTTKGIEAETQCFSSDILVEVLGVTHKNKITFLSGPSFALEVAQRLPTVITLAAFDVNAAKAIQQMISSDFLRAYVITDVIGLEVAGAFKNVVAIAAGVIDGLTLGQNAKAALITRGLAEISRLAVAMGGVPATLSGLSGIGDLMLTCYGDLSRNRQVGLELARGVDLSEIMSRLSQVAEGVHTAKSARLVSQKYGVEMPICESVYKLLYGNVSPNELVFELMTRRLGAE
jgi:glycerol-3-phosphate dehydrogenase (NAD(P)+)